MFRFLPWRRRRPEGPPGAGDGGALPEHPAGAAGTRQEQPEVRSSPSGIQALGKDSGDKPGVPRQARNGNGPREGTDRPRRRAPLPPGAGNGEDEEGKRSSNSRSRAMDSATQNGNVPREGMDQPVCVPTFWVVSREGGEGEPSSNSQSWERDTATASRNRNVPREGTDRPRRRAPAPPQLPPWAGRREDEEGEASSNSRSRDMGTALQNGNVPREGTDRPVRLPSVWAVRREDEEGKRSSNSRSQGRDMDKDSATRNGNGPREGMDQPVCIPTFWIVNGEDEEGEARGNSWSQDKDTSLRNGNVPRGGMDQPVCVPTVWVVSREGGEGEPSRNSQSNSQSRDTATATHNGNVPREGTDRPVHLPSVGIVSGEDEEGEPSSNSQSRGRDTDKDTATSTCNGNVPGEGMDQPVCIPTVWIVRGEGEEGEPSSNSRSRGRNTDKDTATSTCNGNGPREGMDQPVCIPTVWIVSGEDEEGEPSSNSRSRGRDTASATTPGRDRRTEPPSGAERREWLLQRLLQLGEDMENWEGKPTAELAAGLARRIAGTPHGSCPEGPGGTRSARRERGSGASPDRGTPGGIYRDLRGMLGASGSTESAEEDSGSGSGSDSGSGLGLGSDCEQGSAASPDHDIPSRNYGSFFGMLRASRNSVSAEEDSSSGSSSGSGSGLGSGSGSDWEQGSGASPDHDIPSGNFGRFLGMLRVSGNAESAEEDSGSEQEQDQGQDEEQQQGQAAVNLRLLVRRFPEVLARSRLDCGRVAKEELLDGGPVPFQRQHRLHPDEERQMAELLQEYLEQGIVVEGTSKSNNPLILYQKPHGRGARLSLDCGALNAATPVEPQEPLDRDGLLTSINPRSRFFSVLDLSNACLAIPLAPSCRHRFAFTFQGRQFLFTRLPPLFHGTGSILHRRVAAMLAQLDPGTARGVFHYSDDILITGKCRRQLRFRTRRVLQLIHDTGFKVNRHKAQLVQPEVNYLGMTLSAAGRRVSQEKLRQICQDCDAAEPWGPAWLRSILGKFNDLKEFIADYLELALPLQGLAVPEKWKGERERQWRQEWEREGREQLQRLKEALKAAPALLFPNKSRPFVIRLSVHARSVGAVLLQEKEGALLPVRHCSHKLSGQSWTLQDASCLAAVRAVQAFEKLTGPAPILIRGPAGSYLLRGEPLLDGYTGDSELPERWRLLVTTKGSKRQESQTVSIRLAPELREYQWLSIPLAPALRQLPDDIPKSNVWFLAVERGSSGKQCVAFAAASLEERWLLGLRRGPEEEEAVLEALKELLDQHRSCRPLFLYSGWPKLAPRLKQRERAGRCSQGAVPEVLRRLRSFPGMLQVRQVGTHGNAAPDERRWMQEVTARARAVAKNPTDSWKVWEPSASERQEIVAQCHRWCHDGVKETLRRVQHVKSWRSVHEDVARWVRRCPRCQEGNSNPNPDLAPQRERGPWSRLQLSLAEGLPQGPEGFRALLLVQDELSGWLEAFPLREPAPPEVSQVLLQKVFGRFGRVGTVLLDPKLFWLWPLLRQPPLLGWHGRLEPAFPTEEATGMLRVVRALGKGWAAALSLIRAGIAAQWVREEELGALLCIPGLPLEVRCRKRDWRGNRGGNGNGNGDGDGNGNGNGNGDGDGNGNGNGNGNGDGNGNGNGNGDAKENELQQLRPMEILKGYRQRVQNVLW